MTPLSPESFLNNVILKDPNAEKWLVNHLSISRKLHLLDMCRGKALPVWMLTGIYTLQNGQVSILEGIQQGYGIGGQAPFPEPVLASISAATGLGGGAIDAQFNLQQGSHATQSYG